MGGIMRKDRSVRAREINDEKLRKLQMRVNKRKRKDKAGEGDLKEIEAGDRGKEVRLKVDKIEKGRREMKEFKEEIKREGRELSNENKDRKSWVKYEEERKKKR